MTQDLQKFCEALSLPQEIVKELVGEGADGEPAWSLAFDVDNCPASVLPYLAQFVGVVITPEMTEEQIRNEIRKPTGWERGQDASILIAIQRTLTGTKWVTLRPNNPETGKTYIATLLSETVSPTRTSTIARSVVPAWSVLVYEALEGVTVAALSAGKYETVATLSAAFVDVDAVTHILPSEL